MDPITMAFIGSQVFSALQGNKQPQPQWQAPTLPMAQMAPPAQMQLRQGPEPYPLMSRNAMEASAEKGTTEEPGPGFGEQIMAAFTKELAGQVVSGLFGRQQQPVNWQVPQIRM